MIPYCLNAAILLTACLLFYKALLQSQTFYTLNRTFLLACLILSFALPLISVPQKYSLGLLPQNGKVQPAMRQSPIKENEQGNSVKANLTKNALKAGVQQIKQEQVVTPLRMRLLTWLGRLYWFGVLAMGANFFLQLILLFYQYYKNPVIKDGSYRIVEINGDKAPCSFANFIFINPAKYDWDTYNQILLHEKVHIGQIHTIDLVLAEITLIFQWFNPFAWYYRKTLENNLEFLTDAQVLQSPQIEKESYQLSLLKVSAPHFALNLTTNYNQSLLKKRIVMMGTKKSNWHTLWKYVMVVPVLAFMVCTLNEPVNGNALPIHLHDFAPELSSSQKHAELKAVSNNLGTDSIKSKVVVTRSKTHPAQVGKLAQPDIQNSSLSSIDTLSILREQEITPLFMHDFENVGFKAHHYTDWIILKKYNLSASSVKEFMDLGFKQISAIDLSTLSDLKISPDYIKSFQNLGYQKEPLSHFYTFKIRNITTDFIKSFNDIGFLNITFSDLTTLKEVGVKPDFVADMQQQGYHYMEVKKYIQLMPFKRKLMKDSVTYQVVLPGG